MINKVHNAKSQREAKACSQDNVHGDFSIWFENCDPVALKEKTKKAREDDKNREANDEHSNGIDALTRLRQNTKKDHRTNQHERNAENEGEKSVDADFKQRRIYN